MPKFKSLRRARRALPIFAIALSIGTVACGGESSEDSVGPAANEILAGAGLDANEARSALLEALREPDPFVSTERLAKLLPTLGPGGARVVQVMLEDIDLHFRPAEIDLFVRYWALHVPEDATRWALIAHEDFRQSAIMAAFETWSRSDPQAAIQALIVSGSTSKATMNALIRGWYAAKVPGLTDYIRDFGQSIERQRALNVLARAMINQDGVKAATEWAESLPDEPASFKLAAYRQLGSELAKVDTAAATAWCDAHCEDEKFGNNVRERIAHQWAKRDGRGAMEWLRKAPAGSERDGAVRAAFRGWRVYDQKALFAWFSEFKPEGLPEWLHPAAGIYAMGISWDEPVEALEWAKLVPDPENRDLAMLTIARRWREVDPEGAEAWLAQSPLSEDQRAKARVFPDAYRGRKTGVELNEQKPTS